MAAPSSPSTIAGLFDAVARAHPDALAALGGTERCTYGALRSRADALARALIARGVAREVPVGVCVPRSIESVVAVLGVLLAGGAYVPIDPAYPSERQRWMAQDAGVAVVLVPYGIPPPGWASASAVVEVPRGQDLSGEPLLDPPARAPDDLLCILYTSGSTGRPKGVCGAHGAMLNRLRWAWEAFPLGAGDVLAHRSSLNFVDAGPELFTGLLRGTPTAVVSPDEQADLRRFVAALERHRVTRVTVVPSLLASLVRALPDLGARLPALRLWITSGEELSLPLLRSFRAAHPEATLVNLYGTTEVTGDVTSAVFAPGQPLPRERVPIGYPIAGAELLVLDGHRRPVPAGAEGELYVAGPVLARGYHHRPHEEGVRFPRHPARSGERVFRTGDLVRHDRDGSLLYLGRSDDLVKLRGVRVELGEVERTLHAACPSVRELVAVLVEGLDRLMVCVTPADADLAALRSAAERELSAAMQPSGYLPLDALPLLPNGKCDRRAIAAMVRGHHRPLPPERRPQTSAELRIAALWGSLLRRTDLARDDTFAGLGGDSLALAEMLLALEKFPGGRTIDRPFARDATLAALALALEGDAAPAAEAKHQELELTLTPLGEVGASDAAVIAMLVEASMDAALCSATELPLEMDQERARAYCVACEGVVLRVGGVPVGAGIVQRSPNIGDGVGGLVVAPAGSVQLDEWLLARWRGRGILDADGAWPLLAAWLAERYDHEVSVVWEDHAAMLAILRERGYTRLGRTYWRSAPEGDGTEGFCEVWLYDLRPHRARAV